MSGDENRQHWDGLGRGYRKAWTTASRKRISRNETEYIRAWLPGGKVHCLDIGCGTGRILEVVDAALAAGASVDAIDIAPAMLDSCRLRPWRHEARFALCDVSKEAIPFVGTEWDCVTSIRVVKYNKNWEEIIEKVAGRLAPGGVFVFTMPNRRSLNIFGRYAIPHYRTTRGEINRLAVRLGLEVADIRGFSRIPDVFYQVPGRLADWCLAGAETLLGWILGKRIFQREFFIVLRKPLSVGGEPAVADETSSLQKPARKKRSTPAAGRVVGKDSARKTTTKTPRAETPAKKGVPAAKPAAKAVPGKQGRPGRAAQAGAKGVKGTGRPSNTKKTPDTPARKTVSPKAAPKKSSGKKSGGSPR